MTAATKGEAEALGREREVVVGCLLGVWASGAAVTVDGLDAFVMVGPTDACEDIPSLADAALPKPLTSAPPARAATAPGFERDAV